MLHYITKYKSMELEQLLDEVRRLKNMKEWDNAKTEKLEYLAKEILIKV